MAPRRRLISSADKDEETIPQIPHISNKPDKKEIKSYGSPTSDEAADVNTKKYITGRIVYQYHQGISVKQNSGLGFSRFSLFSNVFFLGCLSGLTSLPEKPMIKN
jgi:hypothetical protein